MMRQFIDIISETEFNPYSGGGVTPAELAMEEIVTIDNSSGQVSCSIIDAALIRIDRIVVDGDRRGQGSGSAMLKQVCDIADKHQVALELEPASTGDMDNMALYKWYQRYGFNGDMIKSSLAGTDIMTREPE